MSFSLFSVLRHQTATGAVRKLHSRPCSPTKIEKDRLRAPLMDTPTAGPILRKRGMLDSPGTEIFKQHEDRDSVPRPISEERHGKTLSPWTLARHDKESDDTRRRIVRTGPYSVTCA